MNNNTDAAGQEKPTRLWVRRLFTVVLMVGVATGVGLGLATLTNVRDVPVWVALIAAVLFIAAYVGAGRLVKIISAKWGFVLDGLVGIPLGLFFLAFHLAFAVREGFLGTLANVVFVVIVAWNISGYFYTRYPRQRT